MQLHHTEAERPAPTGPKLPPDVKRQLAELTRMAGDFAGSARLADFNGWTAKAAKFRERERMARELIAHIEAEHVALSLF